MRRIHKFLNLSSGERRLLIKTWILLGVIRLGLDLFPFSTLRKLVFKLTFLFHGLEKDFSEEYLVWSVAVVSPYVPKTTCLAQALAAQFLLQQAGHQARLHIGVEEPRKGSLKAHAWVESQGKILIGGFDINRYTHLLALE
jgi:Transglutaminase-like superfamily